jgi:hypothetical protein
LARGFRIAFDNFKGKRVDTFRRYQKDAMDETSRFKAIAVQKIEGIAVLDENSQLQQKSQIENFSPLNIVK